MRIAGVRISPEYARLLAQMLADAGYARTAGTLTDAIAVEALEAPLALDDYEAILVVLGDHCPTGLARLRRELLEDERWRRRVQGA